LLGIFLTCGFAPPVAATTFPNDGSGLRTFQVPAGITAVHITAIGGKGQDGSTAPINNGTIIIPGGAGGWGSIVVATIPVTPGSTLSVDVASADMHGGLAGLGEPFDGRDGSNGGAGGNASWVAFTDALGHSTDLVIAGGGGGGGGAGAHSFGDGGAGGSETVTSSSGLGWGGAGGNNGQDDGAPGGPGSQTSGGVNGAGGHGGDCVAFGIEGQPGSAYLGGVGGTAGTLDGSFRNCQPGFTTSGGGGGGGGGYYGGGGGGGADSQAQGGGGGGAGSSFVITGGTLKMPISAAHNHTVEIPASVTITPVDTPPVITSANSGTLVVGSFGSLALQATGFPLPSLRFTGDAVQGVFFDNNHDGTATYSGTPAFGEGRVHNLTIIAENTDSNGVLHSVTQAFALTVQSLPSFFSSNTITFASGQAGSFAVQTQSGFPVPTPDHVGSVAERRDLRRQS